MPTYKEVTKGIQSMKVEGGKEETVEEEDEDNELDEEFEDVVDHFESTYNFRYEEP